MASDSASGRCRMTGVGFRGSQMGGVCCVSFGVSTCLRLFWSPRTARNLVTWRCFPHGISPSRTSRACWWFMSTSWYQVAAEHTMFKCWSRSYKQGSGTKSPDFRQKGVMRSSTCMKPQQVAQRTRSLMLPPGSLRRA
jgi:hypothetical protein